MNAKELASIYKPLWDVVPEARPDQQDPVFGEWIRSHVIEGYAATVAAALCRVAAEDWLIDRQDDVGIVTITPWRGGYAVCVTCDADESGYHGPTKHHALVAACLAVHANSSPNPAASPHPLHPPA